MRARVLMGWIEAPQDAEDIEDEADMAAAETEA
jgi:hypothetical protein